MSLFFVAVTAIVVLTDRYKEVEITYLETSEHTSRRRHESM
ncbi:hypothetical protein [Pyrofollis japonicus]|nr:hypothetical protein [Pyrofollis japonicus]